MPRVFLCILLFGTTLAHAKGDPMDLKAFEQKFATIVAGDSIATVIAALGEPDSKDASGAWIYMRPQKSGGGIAVGAQTTIFQVFIAEGKVSKTQTTMGPCATGSAPKAGHR